MSIIFQDDPTKTLEERVRAILRDELSTPPLLPAEFRSWLPTFIESSNVQVPKSQVIGFASAEIPVGAIIAYGAASAPAGWILCDGSAVSRAANGLLFAAIGTTYGAGDGSTTFNVPDLRQRFPLGKAASGTGATLGGTGGAIDHAHTIAHTHDMQNHTHGVTRFSSPADTNYDGSTFIFISEVNTSTGGPSTNTTGGASTGNSGSANPPFQTVNYIIKAL